MEDFNFDVSQYTVNEMEHLLKLKPKYSKYFDKSLDEIAWSLCYVDKKGYLLQI